MGKGARSETSFASRIACQNAAGITADNAATSSAIRSGRLEPGITAATAGFARENCNAAALMSTPWAAAMRLICSTLLTIAGLAFWYSKCAPPAKMPELYGPPTTISTFCASAASIKRCNARS
ncbi:hypothetical protein D3C84_923520 [compost metagenome]